MKLTQILGEYFFGTETRKLREAERGLLNEYVTNTNALEQMINSSKLVESAEIFAGRIVPDVMSVVSVAAAIIAKEPFFLTSVGCAEVARCILLYKTWQGRYSQVHKVQERGKILRDMYAIEKEGEEWKQE